MNTYSEVTNEVLTIAREVIDEYHHPLKEANIGFIFQEKATTSKGKTVYATAKKPPGWLSGFPDWEYDFVIVIAEDIWSHLADERKRALIDHELCHCRFEDGKASIRAHDVEEFSQIVERHGLWNQDLYLIAPKIEKAAQLELGISEKEEHQGKLEAIPVSELVEKSVEAINEIPAEHGISAEVIEE